MAALETSFQIALRNCSKEVRKEPEKGVLKKKRKKKSHVGVPAVTIQHCLCSGTGLIQGPAQWVKNLILGSSCCGAVVNESD